MKNMLLRLLVLTLIGPSLLLARDRSKKNESQEEPTILTLAEFSKAMEAGMEVEKFKNVILPNALKEPELPPKMTTIRGDIFSLEPNLLTLKLLKTCYIRSGMGSLKFSSDLKQWEEFSEFFTGKAAAALEFQSQVTLINMELELNLHRNRWELPLQQYHRTPCKNVYIHTWSPSLPLISSGQGYIPDFHEEQTEVIRRR